MRSVIAARLEDSSTPAETRFGVEPPCGSFKTISFNTFVVKIGKLSSAYHAENWSGRLRN